MNNVNKTLYIPLYGKSYVSRKGLFLEDKKAEEIWDAEGFAVLATAVLMIGLCIGVVCIVAVQRKYNKGVF